MDVYLTLKQLGAGAFASVALVRHQKTKKLYALKTIEVDENSPDRSSQTLMQRIRVLVRLRHPHIVNCHEWMFDCQGNYLRFIVDYCEAGPLRDRIEEAKNHHISITESQILSWFTQICAALVYLHAKTITHNEITPDNCFLTRQTFIKLGHPTIGTRNCTTSDLSQSLHYAIKNDIWQLGCLLYELCALKLPYSIANSRDFERSTEALESIPKCFSPALEQMLHTILLSYPDNRPSAKQILQFPIMCEQLNNFIANQEQDKVVRAERKELLRHTPAIFRNRSMDSTRDSITPITPDWGSFSSENMIESMLQRSPVLVRRQRSLLSPPSSPSRRRCKTPQDRIKMTTFGQSRQKSMDVSSTSSGRYLKPPLGNTKHASLEVPAYRPQLLPVPSTVSIGISSDSDEELCELDIDEDVDEISDFPPDDTPDSELQQIRISTDELDTLTEMSSDSSSREFDLVLETARETMTLLENHKIPYMHRVGSDYSILKLKKSLDFQREYYDLRSVLSSP